MMWICCLLDTLDWIKGNLNVNYLKVFSVWDCLLLFNIHTGRQEAGWRWYRTWSDSFLGWTLQRIWSRNSQTSYTNNADVGKVSMLPIILFSLSFNCVYRNEWYLILKRAIVDISLVWSAVYGLLCRNLNTQQAEYFINYMTEPEADAHICILTVLIYPRIYMLQVKMCFQVNFDLTYTFVSFNFYWM